MRITNKNVLDVPVDVKESDMSHHKDGTKKFKHPSYGMVRVSRGTSSKGTLLFGAKHPSSSIMTLTISKAENTQNLGSNWYYAYETVTEVEMSPVQYAELISNPNTQGVPCTIKYTNKDGKIEYKPHATDIEYLEEKIKHVSGGLSDKLRSRKHHAKELLTQKGALKKADKEELLGILQRMDIDIQSSIPFYKKCLDESMDRMVMEVNSDIESLVSGIQTKLGKKALDNPEALSKLLQLEDKED